MIPTNNIILSFIKMNNISGDNLVRNDGKCWSHKGKYLGKHTDLTYTGRNYDRDNVYHFENGTVTGLGLKFKEVPCEKKVIVPKFVYVPKNENIELVDGGSMRKSKKQYSRRQRIQRKHRTHRKQTRKS